jgi:hypothetical protein
MHVLYDLPCITCLCSLCDPYLFRASLFTAMQASICSNGHAFPLMDRVGPSLSLKFVRCVWVAVGMQFAPSCRTWHATRMASIQGQPSSILLRLLSDVQGLAGIGWVLPRHQVCHLSSVYVPYGVTSLVSPECSMWVNFITI